MDRKKKVILNLVIVTVLFMILYIAFFNISTEYIDTLDNKSNLFFAGSNLCFFAILIIASSYVSYKNGLIFISPWKHGLWGGEHSWWSDEDKEPEFFWRIIILSITISIIMLSLGVAMIIIYFYFI